MPSDALAAIRDLAAHAPALKDILGEVPRVDIIVDANVILNEIEYLACSRERPCPRTVLQELAASGTVRVFVPLTLEAEVERHLPKVAARHRADVQRLMATWSEYRTALGLFQPDAASDEERLAAADPEDVPYKELWLQLGRSGDHLLVPRTFVSANSHSATHASSGVQLVECSPM